MDKGLIFTCLLTYGGALGSLFNPFVGLLIYVCFALIKPEALWHWSFPAGGGNYSRIVAIALLLGWGLKGCGSWKLGSAKGIVLALLFYLFWSVVGSTQCQNPAIAWNFVEALSKIVLPFVVGITTIDSEKKLKQLVWVIVLSQGYVAYEANLAYYNGYMFRGGIFIGLGSNSLAITMVSVLGMAFFLGFQAERWWMKGIAMAACGLMVHTVMFTFSRGGIIALIITGVAVFLLTPKKPKHYIMFVLAVVLTLRLAGAEVRERFVTTFAEESERDESARDRMDLWRDCIDLMLKNPVFGVGPNHWPVFAPSYGWPPNKEAHSLWMQTAAELGLPGVVALASFYGLGMYRLCPMTRKEYSVSDPWLSSVARMVIASSVGFAVSSQFVTTEGLEGPYYIILAGAAALKLRSSAKPLTESAKSDVEGESTSSGEGVRLTSFAG